MTFAAASLVALLCVVTMAIGAVGLVTPARLVGVARRFLSTGGLFLAVGLRLVLGVALWVAAPVSATPAALRVLGVLIVIAALGVALLGLPRLERFVAWWERQPEGVLRIWSFAALAFAAFMLVSLAAGGAFA